MWKNLALFLFCLKTDSFFKVVLRCRHDQLFLQDKFKLSATFDGMSRQMLGNNQYAIFCFNYGQICIPSEALLVIT